MTSIVGQKEIQARLARQLHENAVPHALLFCGPEGSGKLAVALRFAQALLCKNPNEGQPCGQCQGCKMAGDFVHPDLHFVFPVIKQKGQSGDAVSDMYLKEWREVLRTSAYVDYQDWLERMLVQNQQAQIAVAESDQILRKLSLTSQQGGYKVMIIWLPELMNVQAANKLLKILEEPPKQTVFILVSNNSDKLLTTILSRTQRVAFKPLSKEDVSSALIQQCGLQEADARRIAHQSAGNFTRALKQIRVDADNGDFFERFVQLMRMCYQRDIKGIKNWSEEIADWGRERQKDFLDYVLYLVRENFMYNFQIPELNFMSQKESDFSVRFARFINERNVVEIMEAVEEARRDVGQNVNPKMIFFDFGLRMIVLIIRC